MLKSERFWEYVIVIGLVAVLGLLGTLLLVKPFLEQRLTYSIVTPMGQQEDLCTARVVEIIEEGSTDSGSGVAIPYQRLQLRIENGPLAEQEVVVEEGTIHITTQEALYRPGDRVYLVRVKTSTTETFYIRDLVRLTPLLWIAGIFISLVLLIGGLRGLRSLGGMVLSLVIIFAFIVPQILAGRDPVLVTLIGSIVLLTTSNYLIYGWNPKAHAALAGMTLSLVLTAVLAWLFTGWSGLTGLTSEESAFLVMEVGGGANLKGLLFGGMVIGALGVLDDICVGQSSAVFELVQANRDLGWQALFRHSLSIGRDHAAASVNTLLLAYAGTSLPLLLLFAIYQEPLWLRLNSEPVAEEIVRTLVGSMGLLLAVPITGLLASLWASWKARRQHS
jgi:uncharacterized membrane protein